MSTGIVYSINGRFSIIKVDTQDQIAYFLVNAKIANSIPVQATGSKSSL